MLKRILSIFLSAVMLLGLWACGKTDTPAGPTQPENAAEILAARREKVVAYMRQMGPSPVPARSWP